MSPWAIKGAPEPLRLPDSEHTMTKTAALREKERLRGRQPRAAWVSSSRMLPDTHRPFTQRLQKHLQASEPSTVFTHIITLSASGVLLSRWLEGTSRQASRLNFPSGGSGLPDRAQVSVCWVRPGLLFPSSPFLAVLDSAFGEMSRSFGIWKHFGS